VTYRRIGTGATIATSTNAAVRQERRALSIPTTVSVPGAPARFLASAAIFT
jgi:hypothetical protein